MIHSLNIKNYKNLERLKLIDLARVNLVTGKNNVGKSTLLEALAIYASKGDFNVIGSILIERGEFLSKIDKGLDLAESNIKAISSIFFNRQIGFDESEAIFINELNYDLEANGNNSVFINVVNNNELAQSAYNPIFKDSAGIETEVLGNNLNLSLQIKTNKKVIVPLASVLPISNTLKSDHIQFIKTFTLNTDITSKLFDRIALTDKEKFVIQALKLIEPSAERIAFIGSNDAERTAIIKLSRSNETFPLRSMGDGINRILTIILSMVNAEKGYLLIDEFENGLHYSVQIKLWEIIFFLAEKLDIQVFATTHSEDCIAGFTRTLNDPENKVSGKLIRLDNVNGEIRQVDFNAEELKIADDQDIEIR